MTVVPTRASGPQPVVLGSGRYVLRTLSATSPSDDFRRWTADARMMHSMNLPARSLTPRQVADYWASFDNQTKFFFGIFDQAGQPCGFWLVECDPLHDTATLQLAIDPAHRGVCAQETFVALLDWLFEVRRIFKLIIHTLPANRHVLRILSQFGFAREGVLRQEIKNLAGTGRHDQWRYGLLASDWPAARKKASRILEAKLRHRARKRDLSDA